MDTKTEEKPKEKKGRSSVWETVPAVVERVVGVVENFADTVLNKVSSSADSVVDRGIQKLFGLLALGAGMVFFLAGGAKVLDSVLGVPGVGSMVIGVFLLLLTAIFILAKRA